MNKLLVSPSPHFFTKTDTSAIMFDVILALFPALIAGIVFFGPRALIVTLVCVVSCVAFEWLVRKIMKRSNTIGDYSAVVTGVLLAFNLPPAIPIWMAVLGSFFAIVIVKQLFGGIGQNFANPAITARIILLASFGTQMTTWSKPFGYQGGVDAVASATPLADLYWANPWDLFIGNVSGCIGEVSALALLLGGVYLSFRKVINPLVPLTFIGTVFVFTWVLGENPVNHILAGGLMLGAIFMATDYATTPPVLGGKLIFALGCGIITTLIRVFGNYPEGVSFAILLMNLLTPLIDRIPMVNPIGKRKKGGAA